MNYPGIEIDKCKYCGSGKIVSQIEKLQSLRLLLICASHPWYVLTVLFIVHFLDTVTHFKCEILSN